MSDDRPIEASNEPALPPKLGRALILHHGESTPGYAFMEHFVQHQNIVHGPTSDTAVVASAHGQIAATAPAAPLA